MALRRVALTTGRRVADLAGLCGRDLAIAEGRVTITVQQAKDGKVMRDRLAADVAVDLLRWLRRHHGVARRSNLGARLSEQAGPLGWLRQGTPAGQAQKRQSQATVLVQRAEELASRFGVCRRGDPNRPVRKRASPRRPAPSRAPAPVPHR